MQFFWEKPNMRNGWEPCQSTVQDKCYYGGCELGEAKGDAERQKREKSDFLRYKDSKGLFADFHAMRHTFITNLCRANVPPKTAQALARHSDIRLTMNTYSHVGQQEQAAAIGRLKGVANCPNQEI